MLGLGAWSSAPFVKMVAVTPTDTAATTFESCRGLWIGVGGTITFINPDGTSVATTVPNGLFPVSAIRVAATGTTATSILAGY